MSALVAAELVKLRTTRAWMGYLAAAVLLTGLGAAGRLGSAQRIELGTQAFQRNLLSHSLVSGLLALVVGVVIVTVEWRHGTITRTFLVTPRRERVLLAKAAVAALAGTILALVSVAVVLAVAVPWLAADGATLRVLASLPLSAGSSSQRRSGGCSVRRSAPWCRARRSGSCSRFSAF